MPGFISTVLHALALLSPFDTPFRIGCREEHFAVDVCDLEVTEVRDMTPYCP